jgi:hypothetical protein
MKIEMYLTAKEMLKMNEVLVKLGLKDSFKEDDKGLVQDTPAIRVEVSPLNFANPFRVTMEYKAEFTTALMDIIVKNATPLKMLIQSGASFINSMMAVCGDLVEDFKKLKKDFGIKNMPADDTDDEGEKENA